MNNSSIADNFSLLAKLMDIHGENSFKTKSYSSAAFTIEKLPAELSAIAEEKIFAIKGIGEAIGKKIIEQLMKNARMTYVEVAKNCRVTHSAVHQRIKKMKEAGMVLDLPVLDHIIVGDGNYYSFADEGIM